MSECEVGGAFFSIRFLTTTRILLKSFYLIKKNSGNLATFCPKIAIRLVFFLQEHDVLHGRRIYRLWPSPV